MKWCIWCFDQICMCAEGCSSIINPNIRSDCKNTSLASVFILFSQFYWTINSNEWRLNWVNNYSQLWWALSKRSAPSINAVWNINPNMIWQTVYIAFGYSWYSSEVCDCNVLLRNQTSEAAEKLKMKRETAEDHSDGTVSKYILLWYE